MEAVAGGVGGPGGRVGVLWTGEQGNDSYWGGSETLNQEEAAEAARSKNSEQGNW